MSRPQGNWLVAISKRMLVRVVGFLAACAMACSGCSINKPWSSLTQPDAQASGSGIALLMPYEEAVSVSGQTGKPVMLFFTGSDWCIWCERLKQEVFETPEFESWARNHVLMVELDFPQTTRLPTGQQVLNDRLQREYADYIESFPTALFVDSQGQVIGKIGYEKGGPDNWIEAAERAISGPSS